MGGDYRPFPGLGFRERNAVAFREAGQRFPGTGIFHTAAANNQRLAAGLNGRDRIRQLGGAGRAAIETMHAAHKERLRVIPGFALHILRQTESDGTGFRRIGQDAHRINAGAHQLFRTRNAVPVFADGPEGVVGADAQVIALLNLLQHRVRLTGSKHIAGQQQQRNAVGGGRRGGGNHIGRARTDGRGAGDDLAAQRLAGKTGGDVRHALFVTPLEDPHVAAVLFQRLAQPQHVAVAKDGEDTFYEFMLFAIDVEKLVIKELHQRLRHCQSQFAHLAQSLLFSICVWVSAFSPYYTLVTAAGNR